METHHPDLTSAEVASLWTQYMNETMGLCINRYMLEKVVDSNIRSLFEYAIHLGENHVEKIKAFLSSDNFPIPKDLQIMMWISRRHVYLRMSFVFIF